MAAGAGLVYAYQFREPDLDSQIRSRYARGQSKLDRILLVLSVTAIGATCTTIGVGNYPVIVVALLVGAYQAEQAGRPISSGLLMGMALLKPQV